MKGSIAVRNLILFLGLLYGVVAAAGSPYSNPRVTPATPVPGEPVQFLVDWDGCGNLGIPTTQIVGNVITIVQPLELVCFLPPPSPPPLTYAIGPFTAGNFIARYSIVSGANTIFGPVDVPFTVAGTARAIPAAGVWALAILSMLMLAAAAHRRRSEAVNR
jgi:hypothetical protein